MLYYKSLFITTVISKLLSLCYNFVIFSTQKMKRSSKVSILNIKAIAGTRRVIYYIILYYRLIQTRKKKLVYSYIVYFFGSVLINIINQIKSKTLLFSFTVEYTYYLYSIYTTNFIETKKKLEHKSTKQLHNICICQIYPNQARNEVKQNHQYTNKAFLLLICRKNK
jgi:hypothetical protein